MGSPAAWGCALGDALFLDIPYIVDSAWRHVDYRLNRLHRFSVPVPPNTETVPVVRPYAALPPFAFLLLVILYVIYGPTLRSLCSVVGSHGIDLLRFGSSWLIGAGAVVTWGVVLIILHGRIRKRFDRADIHDRGRYFIVHGVLFVVATAILSPLALLARALQHGHGDQFASCLLGSSPGPAMVQFVVLAASTFLAYAATRRVTRVWLRIAVQAAVIVALTGWLWWSAGVTSATEAGQGPYFHLYAVVAAGVAVIATLAPLLLRLPFRSLTDADRAPFRQALASRELFSASRHDPDLSLRRILGGGVIGILQAPLQFLLIPAFATLLAPSDFIGESCLGGVVAALLLTIAGNLTSRWDRMLAYVRRYFLLGTPLVASCAVMVIAALRLNDVQYVATVLNVAPFGTLFVWMIMAYALAWWFEYQVNGVLAAELLRIFGAPGGTDTAVIPYRLDPNFQTSCPVRRDNRFLLAHGTGEFIVVGVLRENATQRLVVAFNPWSFSDLMSALLERDTPDAVHELGRRAQLYFALVNLTLAVGLAALLWHHGWGDAHNTVRAVATAALDREPRGQADLADLLLQRSETHRPAIIVAASGGGTRAALYAETVLKGLHDLGADRDIVLVSGVSGGGAAAAYFYGHHESLLRGQPEPCGLSGSSLPPWDCFSERMTEPFIRDVLEGAGEWRLQSELPLGVLLAESFARRLFWDGSPLLGDSSQLGLILNTTITGHPVRDAPTLIGAFRPTHQQRDGTCPEVDGPVSMLAGGRLAFTNLAGDVPFSRSSDVMPNIRLPFVLVRDGEVPLASAAALNANFPPVFPSARVDLTAPAPNGGRCVAQSYFVTDGGATENLGLISALLAVETALGDARLKGKPLDLHFVLAEASAMSYDYAQDRGVGAATGDSKERLAGGLTLDLVNEVVAVTATTEASSRVTFHDLSLPRVFRSRGGFGTHWMFPETIRIVTPQPEELPPAWQQVVEQFLGRSQYRVALQRRDLVDLWSALFPSPRGHSFCAVQPTQWTAEAVTVAHWICGIPADGGPALTADPLPARWELLKGALTTSH